MTRVTVEVPAELVRMELAGESVRLAVTSFRPAIPGERMELAARIQGEAVLVVPDADTFFAQTSELFEAGR